MKSSKGNVLITGGTSGIGFELAKLFLSDGYCVGLVGLTAQHSGDTRLAFAEFSDRVQVYTLDLAEPKNILLLKAQFSTDLGDCHILVNNAGYAVY
jgi:NAD(P)-dependent dehydrogenase (short-subunit alcohol dehydrogenase family)